jgi:hypothetical protein
MATRAQNFRAAEQRSQQRPAPKRPKSKGPSDPAHTATRNVAKRTEKNAQMKLEDSMSGRPSRKSTRRSLHHGRPDEQLQRVAREATHAPRSRALRAQVARH